MILHFCNPTTPTMKVEEEKPWEFSSLRSLATAALNNRGPVSNKVEVND